MAFFDTDLLTDKEIGILSWAAQCEAVSPFPFGGIDGADVNAAVQELLSIICEHRKQEPAETKLRRALVAQEQANVDLSTQIDDIYRRMPGLRRIIFLAGVVAAHQIASDYLSELDRAEICDDCGKVNTEAEQGAVLVVIQRIVFLENEVRERKVPGDAANGD